MEGGARAGRTANMSSSFKQTLLLSISSIPRLMLLLVGERCLALSCLSVGWRGLGGRDLEVDPGHRRLHPQAQQLNAAEQVWSEGEIS